MYTHIYIHIYVYIYIHIYIYITELLCCRPETYMIYFNKKLRNLMCKRNIGSTERGFFMYASVLCCSNEKNINHISCNVPRLNVICLTKKKNTCWEKETKMSFMLRNGTLRHTSENNVGGEFFKWIIHLPRIQKIFDQDSPLSFSNTWDFTLSLSNLSFLLRIF